MTTLPDEQRTPTAIEPARVMVLTEAEQYELLDTLQVTDDIVCDLPPSLVTLRARLQYGDTYVNATDEFVRRTHRQRRLEAEILREKKRIAELEEMIVDDWMANVRSGDKHAPTGATLSLGRTVRAKLDVDTNGLSKEHADQVRAQCKAQVGAVLQQFDETADMVRPDFNMNTLSAYFREQIKTYDEEQRALPEHERRPRDPDSFLPEPLRGLLKIDAAPRITVRG